MSTLFICIGGDDVATVEDIYKKALVLIGEVQDDGTITPSDNEESYKTKTKYAINTLLPELLPKDEDVIEVEGMDDYIQLENKYALSALPYGVATQLLSDQDNSGLMSFYNNKYEELKQKSNQGSTTTKTTDVYNVLGGMT